MLLPQLAYAGVAMVAGKVTDKRGIWPIVPRGFLVISGGFVVILGLAEIKLVIPLLIACLFILGGVGFENSPNRATALEALDTAQVAAGASIASVAIQLASSLSSSLLVGSFSNQMEALIHSGVPQQAAYVTGFQHTILIMVIIEAVMLIIATAYTWRHRKASSS